MSAFNEPMDENKAPNLSNETDNPVDAKAVMSIIDMGFSREEALYALNRSNQDVSRAIEYIFNNSPVISSLDPSESQHIEQASSYTDAVVPYGPQPAPQTSGFYDTNELGSISLEEAIPSPEERDEDKPALLLCCDDAPYLAPLLVILHKIPLARKALLNEGKDLVEDYGFDADWWNGSLMDVHYKTSDLSVENSSGKLTIEHTPARFAMEIQRLMVFLDGKSKRQYARIDNMIKQGAPEGLLTVLADPSKDESPIGGLFNTLVAFWGRNSSFSKSFQTHVHVDDNNSENTSTVFSSLLCDATVAMADNLYDLIDDMVWPPPGMPDNYLYDIADVLCLTIKRDDGESGAGIPVPETWYPARYTKEFVKYVKNVRDRRSEMRKNVISRSKQLDEFAVFNGNDGTKLLSNCMKYLEGIVEKGSENSEGREIAEETSDDTGRGIVEAIGSGAGQKTGEETDNGVGKRIAEETDNGTGKNTTEVTDTVNDNTMSEPSTTRKQITDIQSALQDISNIQSYYENKKTNEKSAIQSIQNESKEMTKLFHGPLDDETFKRYFPGNKQPPMDRYRLKGVIISPIEYCFYTDYDFNGNQTLIDMDDDKGQWWKVVIADNECPQATITTEADVLEWARNGSYLYKWQEVVLIYADDKACKSAENQFNLGPALRQFEQQDEKSFMDDHRRFNEISKPSSETLINSYEMDMSDDQDK